MPFATTWMDLEDIMRKSDGERQILYIITCMGNLKIIKIIHLAKQKQTDRYRNGLVVIREEREGEENYFYKTDKQQQYIL